MKKSEVIIGEFTPFLDEVEAAPLSGSAVELACGRLGNKPPFRIPGEGETLSFDDVMAARMSALESTGIMDIALEVGELDSSISRTVISKSGALAIKGDNNSSLQRVYGLIGFLDDGNANEILLNYPIKM